MPLTMEETLRAAVARKEMARRIRDREARQRESAQRVVSFREYVDHATREQFIWYRHCEAVGEHLQAMADGELGHLIMVAPPRHGKSEMGARLLPGYWAYRFPSQWAAITGYGARLAEGFSRRAQQYYLEAGGSLGSKATDAEWQTPLAGGVFAAGVRGPLTGLGFHLGVIDDPIKNDEEAQSPTLRQKTWDWYDTTFTTRTEPGARQLISLTRWHHDDLVGRLLDNEIAATAAGASSGWVVLHLQALKERHTFPAYPPAVDVVADDREEGEALCEERYSAEWLRGRQKKSPRTFGALYQGNPVPRGGTFIKAEWLEIVPEAPAVAAWVRGWDRAATQDAGDGTAGVLMAKDQAGVYYIVDVVQGHWATGARDRIIRQTAELDGKKVEQAGEQEPGAAGKSDALAFRQNLSDFTTSTSPASGSKLIRAGPWASAAEVGNLKLVRGPWNRDYIERVTAFPFGALDDEVDATSIAYNRLQEKRPEPRPDDYPSLKA